MGTRKANATRALISSFTDDWHERVAAMELDELAAVEVELKGFTETNCGWLSYEIRQPLLFLVGEQLHFKRDPDAVAQARSNAAPKAPR